MTLAVSYVNIYIKCGLGINTLYSNFEAVITSPDFVDLCKENPALVAEFNLAHAERMKEYSRPTKKKKS